MPSFSRLPLRWFAVILATVLFIRPASAETSTLSGAVVRLDLSQAVERALKTNAAILLAHEKISEAGGRKIELISEFVPHLFGHAYQQRYWKENLAALGFPEGGLIGPFNTFDARIEATEKIFDMSAAERARAGINDEAVARWEEDEAKEKIITAAALAYIDVLRGFEKLKAAVSDHNLAKRLLAQARHQKAAGLATGVDVARAETREAAQALVLTEARMDFYQSRLQLERVTGLPFESRPHLMNPMRFFTDAPAASEAVAANEAERNRIDLKISEGQARSSAIRLDAAKAELLPTVSAEASYGVSGNTPTATSGVGDGMIEVNVPIFEGGRTQGAIKESASQKRQADISVADMKRGVEEDVYLAFRRLRTGAGQVDAAGKAVSLAKRELAMARDRFSAGVSDNVEVLSAQAALADARQAYVAALAAYHIARLNCYAALGRAGSFYLNQRMASTSSP